MQKQNQNLNQSQNQPQSQSVQKRNNTNIPMIKRARTRNLAFIFNMAARILKSNPQLVISYTNYATEYILTPQEVVELKNAYGIWLLAYLKGFTNDKPTFKTLASRTGLSESVVRRAIQGKPTRAYTLTYELMKEWGYIDEY